MSELRTRMIRDMTLRGFSPRTHQAYLAHLLQERRRSWSTCSQAAYAFRFLFSRSPR